MSSPNCPECNSMMRFCTVKKDGKNKGRQFWGCANYDRGCKGFIWADEVAPPDPPNMEQLKEPEFQAYVQQALDDHRCPLCRSLLWG